MLKKVLKTVVGFVFLLPIITVMLVRFTDGRIKIGKKVLIDYNESNGVFIFWEYPIFELNGLDGPYLIKNELIRVDENNQISIEKLNHDSILVSVNNSDKDQFYVKLKDTIIAQSSSYKLPEKLIAISDIEGNFNAFSSLLQSNQVVDKELDWSFGKGHLVLVGDFVDRGKDVIQTLWLIYKLEQEAEKFGGKVHFILGNHEIMNIQGNFKYAKDKYKKFADTLGGLREPKANYKLLFSKESHLGRWLRTKNNIEKIGNFIFTHGGLSPEIISLGVGLDVINEKLRKNIDEPLYHYPKEDSIANFIMGRRGTYWYRGLVENYKYYDKITEQGLDSVLNNFNASSIVIGHTVVENVSKGFDGKVIRLDVKHDKEKGSNKTQGLLIENEILYRIDASGNKYDLN